MDDREEDRVEADSFDWAGLQTPAEESAPSPNQGGQGTIAPNLLNREFDTHAPNEIWVTDVTEFGVGDRKLCLSPVMDLFNRQIISYSIGSSPSLGAHQRFAARGFDDA